MNHKYKWWWLLNVSSQIREFNYLEALAYVEYSEKELINKKYQRRHL